MKINIIERVPVGRIGRVNKNGVELEPHEDSALLYLTQYGFDIDVIKPRNTYKTKTADIFMSGAIWELKSPTTFKESTIKSDFRKAKLQSDRIIFDLRGVKKYSVDVEKYILKIFEKPGFVHKLIIIKKDGRVLYYSK